MKEKKENIFNDLETKGISLLTDCKDFKRASDVANTFIFRIEDKTYVLDTACGKKRVSEIKSLTGKDTNIHILSSHYHNDHVSNNGRIALKNSKIIFHHRTCNRIRYLRTNGTGQITMMARELNLEGMLKRFNMFSRWQIKFLLSLSKISYRLPAFFLFFVSYIYSVKSIGRIVPAVKKVFYLEPCSESGCFSDFGIPCWEIDSDFFAFHTPGHSDDHLVFYLRDRGVLFAGDSLNFLNPNDIQFGDISENNKTIDFIIEIVKTENIQILTQGHYLPVMGNKAILDYLYDIKQKHILVYEIIVSIINKKGDAIDFDDLFSEVTSHQDELMMRLSKISFPRSTLVFFDVYTLFVLKRLGFSKGSDGKWYR